MRRRRYAPAPTRTIGELTSTAPASRRVTPQRPRRRFPRACRGWRRSTWSRARSGDEEEGCRQACTPGQDSSHAARRTPCQYTCSANARASPERCLLRVAPAVSASHRVCARAQATTLVCDATHAATPPVPPPCAPLARLGSLHAGATADCSGVAVAAARSATCSAAATLLGGAASAHANMRSGAGATQKAIQGPTQAEQLFFGCLLIVMVLWVLRQLRCGRTCGCGGAATKLLTMPRTCSLCVPAAAATRVRAASPSAARRCGLRRTREHAGAHTHVFTRTHAQHTLPSPL
jgi:hypothetical protein